MSFLKNVVRGALMTAGLIGAAVCLAVAQILVDEAMRTGGPVVAAALAGLASCLFGGLMYAVWKTRP